MNNKLAFVALLILTVGFLNAEESNPRSSIAYSDKPQGREFSEEPLYQNMDCYEEAPNPDVTEESGEGTDETMTAGCFLCHEQKFPYKGIFQNIIYISSDYSIIQLQDGTLWAIDPKDISRVYYWQGNHRLYVTLNRWYFTQNKFEIVNTDLEQIVEANLLSEPIYNFRYIYMINYDDDIIGLKEGYDVFGNPVYSRWRIDHSQHFLINRWDPDDKIIVVANVGFSKMYNLYVLFNFRTNDFAYATFSDMFR